MIRQRIKHLVASLLIAFGGGLVFVPAIASADLQGDACQGVNQLSGSNSSSCSAGNGASVTDIMRTVINILSVIVGFIAVVMIIVGGLRFITAGGDSNAVAGARSTILYAVVGLIIVAIAQVLVHFVLRKL
jgi:hypothetical protein